MTKPRDSKTSFGGKDKVTQDDYRRIIDRLSKESPSVVKRRRYEYSSEMKPKERRHIYIKPEAGIVYACDILNFEDRKNAFVLHSILVDREEQMIACRPVPAIVFNADLPASFRLQPCREAIMFDIENISDKEDLLTIEISGIEYQGPLSPPLQPEKTNDL